jgi:HEPN domain-containing protein
MKGRSFMSIEKSLREALRWLKTAEDDLDAAIVLEENGKFPQSCFHCQQAGEKAIKAIWYSIDEDPWGHSIRKLIDDLQHVDLQLYERLTELKRPAMLLDRFYIPTRYPNGLPDMTPADAFVKEDAESCIEYAKMILKHAGSVVQ